MRRETDPADRRRAVVASEPGSRATTTAGRRWAVASICAQLTALAPGWHRDRPVDSYAVRTAPPSRAQQRDQALAAQIVRVHGENYGVYGARKVWRSSTAKPSRSPAARSSD